MLVFGQPLADDLPENNGMSSERLETINSVFTDYVTTGKLPGVVVLAARNGKVVYHQAIGMRDMENKKPMSTETIFRIASQTKAIVSVGIMMLQEEGKLLLSDPLSKYISEFKETTVAIKEEDGGYKVEKAKREIKIRDLLTHTSGIGYGYGVAAEKWKNAEIQGWYFAHRTEPVLETVKKMANLPMEAHPGERYVYGYNTDILGALIEVVSGQSLDEFLKTKILNPLGMVDTYFYLPKSKASRLSIVYSQCNDRLLRAPKDGAPEFMWKDNETCVGNHQTQGQYLEGPRTSLSGGAGLLSTSMDYAIFLQMMLNNGTYNGTRILSRKSVELMTTNHLDGDHYKDVKFPWDWGVGFGLGFSVTTDAGDRGVLGSLGEYGWGGAYHSSYWVDPTENLVVVYFTQVNPITLDDHQKLRSLIYQAIVD
ncbi:MAG: serine hydrolase [Flavobacteriaceae bacterium]|nr:serine hydrolase [Flavobacteriaceae bacterium]